MARVNVNLNRYVTTDTEQTITASKTFNKSIKVDALDESSLNGGYGLQLRYKGDFLGGFFAQEANIAGGKYRYAFMLSRNDNGDYRMLRVCYNAENPMIRFTEGAKYTDYNIVLDKYGGGKSLIANSLRNLAFTRERRVA